MENKQQTAIEWLVKKISNEMIGEIPMHRWDEIRDVVQQAKEIEKNQIANSYHDGRTYAIAQIKLNGEEYYKDTYGE